MRGGVHRLQMLDADLRVDLRGGDGGVAQELLLHADFGPGACAITAATTQKSWELQFINTVRATGVGRGGNRSRLVSTVDAGSFRHRSRSARTRNGLIGPRELTRTAALQGDLIKFLAMWCRIIPRNAGLTQPLLFDADRAGEGGHGQIVK